jgi:hypothetical protein
VQERKNGRMGGNWCREEVDEGFTVGFRKELHCKDRQNKYLFEDIILQSLCSAWLNSLLSQPHSYKPVAAIQPKVTIQGSIREFCRNSLFLSQKAAIAPIS